MPTLEVMKAVTHLNITSEGGEYNITSEGGKYRRKAFDQATDLISLTDVSVLIEGQMYNKVANRLNEDHKKFIENTYRIDYSTVGVDGYEGNIIKSINWIASSEAKATKVIIITDNAQNFAGIASENLKAVVPSDFVRKVDRAKQLHRLGTFTTLEDALIAVFFIF